MNFTTFLTTSLFIFAGFPQTYKLLKTKSSKDISIITYLFTWCAIALVILQANQEVFWPNMVSFIILTINLTLIIKYDIQTRSH